MGNTAATVQGCVDTPAGAPVRERCFVVRGWALQPGGTAVTRLRARCGALSFEGKCGLPRPDVFSHFHTEASANCGFEIPVNREGLSGPLQVEACVAEGSWAPLAQLQLDQSLSGRFSRRLRWTNFWAKAWMGRPSAWAKVSQSEAEFLFRDIEQRGLLTLRAAAQYAPRQAVPERFPKTGRRAEKAPKLTIATPSFNQAPFLEASLRSVLEQQDVTLDYFVQDGGSTDGSAALLRRIAQEYGNRKDSAARLMHWASEADEGQADALNRAFAHTQCGPEDIMGYLNSDDELEPGAARYVAEYFAKHPSVDVIYGHRLLIDEKGRDIGRWLTPREPYRNLALNDLIPQETLFWRKRLWDKIGGFDTTFHFALDWDLLQRFEKAGARFARVPYFLGRFRLHDTQKTQSQIGETGLREMQRLRCLALGREPAPGEPERDCWRAVFDSALVYALLKRGIRV